MMVCEGVEKRCHLYWKKVMPILFCKVKNLFFCTICTLLESCKNPVLDLQQGINSGCSARAKFLY